MVNAEDNNAENANKSLHFHFELYKKYKEQPILVNLEYR